MALQPLTFEPILKEKVWGGRRLERLGKRLAPGALIGESWELADLASTSPSGGGGAEARSVIRNGPMRGVTLHDAMQSLGAELMGDASPAPDGGFPLLLKFLDARENLSVQTHPSAAYAQAHPGAHLKTESWFVLDTEPGALIYKGVRPGVTPDAFADHIRDGSVVDDLLAVPARAGDCHNLPSGTAHALGAGVLVAEVQTPSDTTFRVYDWGRTDRELHIEQAMQCIDFQAPPYPSERFDGVGSSPLVRTDYFTINQINIEAGASMSVQTSGSPVVYLCIMGSGAIVATERQSFEPVVLAPGSTALTPAALGAIRLEAGDQPQLTGETPVPPRGPIHLEAGGQPQLTGETPAPPRGPIHFEAGGQPQGLRLLEIRLPAG